MDEDECGQEFWYHIDEDYNGRDAEIEFDIYCSMIDLGDSWPIVHNALHGIFDDDPDDDVEERDDSQTMCYTDSAKKHVKIARNALEIKTYTFCNNATLETVTFEMPSSLRWIQTNAFRNASSLRSIQLPPGLSVIRAEAFRDCAALKTMELPESLRVIESEAFCGCISLVTVNLPSSLLSISSGAFANCINLISISIPPHAFISPNCFENCQMLVPTMLREIYTGTYQLDMKRCLIYHCLRERFDDLPLHQLCYKANITSSSLKVMLQQLPKYVALQTDYLGLTALHVLLCNPKATLEMIRMLVEFNPLVLSLESTHICYDSPLDLYLEVQDSVNARTTSAENNEGFKSKPERSIKCKNLQKYKNEMDTILYLNRNLILQHDHSSENQSESADLCPALKMSMNKSSSLEVVYHLAKDSINLLLEMQYSKMNTNYNEINQVEFDIKQNTMSLSNLQIHRNCQQKLSDKRRRDHARHSKEACILLMQSLERLNENGKFFCQIEKCSELEYMIREQFEIGVDSLMTPSEKYLFEDYTLDEVFDMCVIGRETWLYKARVARSLCHFRNEKKMAPERAFMYRWLHHSM